MRALKILVVVMGVLIIGGTLALGIVLVKRTNAGSTPIVQDMVLDQPAGTRILGISSAEGSLALLVQRPDGERVLLVDPRRGRITGEIRLKQ